MVWKRHGLIGLTCLLMVLTAILARPEFANAQTTTITGTVVSSTKNTITVDSSGQYQLFTFASDVRKPDTLPVGTMVRVVSTPGYEPGVRVASDISVGQGAAPPNTPTVPANVQKLERDIEKELRRYQIAVRTGVTLDPELILVGVEGRIGPILKSGVYFRPVFDFGIGEVTTMFSFNADMIYRLPFASGQDRWTSYVGGGVGVNLINQGFNGEEDGRRFEFDDFKSDTAMNILGGVRRRGGLLLEMKTSIYADFSPTLKLTVGYTF